jgi:thioesterase domain-containing protein/NRPS condensation-like uncharacterized protein
MSEDRYSATGVTTKTSEELSVVNPMPLPADEVYVMPATQGQIRFWSLDQMHPGNPALNMPLMWQCKGELNVDLLATAFTLAVRRHEMLRTTFAMVDGSLAQIIGKPYTVPLPVKDLQHLPNAATSQEAGTLIREHAAYRMDLRNGPLLVLKLLKFAPQHHLLLVTMHHIICDGISLGILLRDIGAFYEALVEGTQSHLPELPIQFADFAVWQEEWRKSDAATASLNFWRETLGKDFGRIELPHDASPEGGRDARTDSESGDIETSLISPELTAAAHEFCKNENVTLNILLFSIFCALLYRVTGQRDIVVGSPCANRNEDTEELIGLFMNIQVLRVQVEQGETFRALLTKVQDWTLGAYENQELPFEELIYDSHFFHRNTSFEIPIFFLYQKSFMLTQHVAGVEIVPLRSMSPGAVFEWMFAIVDRPEEGPRLQLEYNPNYFRPATIQLYLNSFIALLQSAVKNPLTRLDEMAPVDELLLSCVAQNSSRAIDAGSAARTARIDDRTEAIIKYGDRPYTTNDPVEVQLLELWRSMLGVEDIAGDTNVFSLGVSSLSILRLVTRMNSLYSMGFGLASLIAAPTVTMVAELVRQRYAPNTATSLVPIQPVGTKPPLYIVHGAGGNVVNFYGLTTRIGADQPVYGVQAQALEANQPALARMEDMAAHYLKEIRRVQPKGPYHLLGYSFGGIVALEMAQQLHAQGEMIGLLGMLDTRARENLGGGGGNSKAPVANTAKPGRLTGYVRRYKGHGGGKGSFDFLLQDLKERRARYVTALSVKMFSKVPAFLKDTFEINTFAARNYKMKPFPGKLTLFRASKQAEAGVPSDNGWGHIFREGIEVHEIPGDHWQVLSEPGIDVLAKSIRDCLAHEDGPAV